MVPLIPFALPFISTAVASGERDAALMRVESLSVPTPFLVESKEGAMEAGLELGGTR